MAVRRFLGAAIVAICVGVPVVEAFDRWDQTLKDGNDTEANVVVAALCVGFALSAVHTAVNRLFRLLSTSERSFPRSIAVTQAVRASAATPIPACSPPVALRL
jgi:hypothetical protein